MSYKRIAQLKQHIIVGTKQTIRALQSNEVIEVIVAKDASGKVTQQVVELAQGLNVPCTYVESKKQLGKACGIDVGTSTAGVKRH